MGEEDEITPTNEAPSLLTIDELIESQQWNVVYHEFEANPDLCHVIYKPSRLGWTKLHWLCSMGSTPPALIDLVARYNPSAITLPDARFGDTCLHIAGRNSQTSNDKVRILLDHVVAKDGVLIRNQFGGTALHSAANHNATLSTLQLLVQANPKILKVTTREGLHAVSALWHAYMQTIPGYMSVARLLQEPHTMLNDEPFERFWNKAEYLATEYYWHTLLSTRRPRQSHQEPKPTPARTNTKDDSLIASHGLLQCNVAINFFKVALAKNPHYASIPDFQGNLPLHRLVQDRPYRLKEREAIVDCLQAYPQAAVTANSAGDYPLWIAIRNKIPWENGVDLLVESQACVLRKRDRQTGLVAFQLAAAVGGRAAIETCFRLLEAQPDLVKTAIRQLQTF